MSNTTEADPLGQKDTAAPGVGEQQADVAKTGKQGQMADKAIGVGSSEQKNLKRSREGEDVGGASCVRDGEKMNVNDGKGQGCPYVSRPTTLLLTTHSAQPPYDSLSSSLAALPQPHFRTRRRLYQPSHRPASQPASSRNRGRSQLPPKHDARRGSDG